MTETDEWLARLTGRMAEAQQRIRDRDRSARHARMRARVLARWPDPAGACSQPRRWALPLAAGALLTAALLAWVVARPQPWTARIDESRPSGQTQLFIAASDDQPVAMSFADGSVLELRPRARVRVETPHDDAASLVLEAGTIEIMPASPGVGAWTLTAGPYRVSARGAALTVSWQPELGSFELAAHSGEVRVQGPRLDGWVAGGEQLRIPGERSEAPALAEAPAVEITAPTEQRRASEGYDEVSPLEAHPHRRSQGRRPLAQPMPIPEPVLMPEPVLDATWRPLARAGSYAEAIAAAEAVGFADLCASLDAEALLELADAGRYAGRVALAREALGALRRRFPGTDPAAAAAFDLGRLASRDPSGCEDASSWFRIYLDERPQGPMSEVARRRIDECAKQRRTTPEPTP